MTENTEGVGTPTPLPPAVDRPGPDHRADVSVSVPNKAFWRTMLQVGPAALLSLVLILPAVIQDVVDGFGQHLPDGFRLWLLGVAGFLTLAASIAARVMANPSVQEWLRTYAPFFSLPTK